MLFITTLAQSEGWAIALSGDLCCLTSYCFWVKQETWVWSFFSSCEMAHCLGTCIYRALGIIPDLSQYNFSLCATCSSKVICNIADNQGKGTEEILIKYIWKKTFYTYLYVTVHEGREEDKRIQKQQTHGREKKMKKYTVNSEKE